MGQQQLLLVILVTILVGIATVVAINVFGGAAEQGNRDAVRQDMLVAAANAQAIWAKPTLLGGTSGDFTVLSDGELLQALGIPGSLDTRTVDEVDEGFIQNENALYTVSSSENEITLTAEPRTWPESFDAVITRQTDGRWTVVIDGQSTESAS